MTRSLLGLTVLLAGCAPPAVPLGTDIGIPWWLVATIMVGFIVWGFIRPK